jgi:hypothetical protein
MGKPRGGYQYLGYNPVDFVAGKPPVRDIYLVFKTVSGIML